MKDLFLAHCYMELSLSEEAVEIYSAYCAKGFSKSIYIQSQMAKCFDNLRGMVNSPQKKKNSTFRADNFIQILYLEGQECKQTFEFIRKLDPYNLDFMDIYSNILFVLVSLLIYKVFF